MAIVTKVQKLGRVVIPQAYRDLYGIQEGDIVELEILRVKHPDGSVVELLEHAQEGREVEA